MYDSTIHKSWFSVDRLCESRTFEDFFAVQLYSATVGQVLSANAQATGSGSLRWHMCAIGPCSYTRQIEVAVLVVQCVLCLPQQCLCTCIMQCQYL